MNLQRCQRYYQKRDVYGSNGGISPNWYVYNTSFATEMRTAPTLATSSAYNSDSGNAISITSGGTQNGMALIESASTGAGVRGGTDSVSGTLKGRAHFSAEL